MLTERQQKSIFCDTETKTRSGKSIFRRNITCTQAIFISILRYFLLLRNRNDPIFIEMTDELKFVAIIFLCSGTACRLFSPM